jgi:hypothetical protein
MLRRIHFISLALVLWASNACADLTFSVYLCADTSCGEHDFQAEVHVGEDGTVNLRPLDKSSARVREFVAQVQEAMAGVRLQQESLAEVERALRSNISEIVKVREEMLGVGLVNDPGATSPFVLEQIAKQSEFEDQLYADVFAPTFVGEYVSDVVAFSVADDGDRKALKTVVEARTKRHDQILENAMFAEADSAAKLIEVRQHRKDTLEQDTLTKLSALADSILNGPALSVADAVTALIALGEFQTGFSLSLANNFNPLDFVYPLEVPCESAACELGATVGDLVSLVVGSAEFLKGVSLTVGSLGGGVAVVVTSAGTTAPLVIPATVSGALAGIALSGHGVQVVGESFSRLYSRLDSESNQARVELTERLVREVGEKRAIAVGKAGADEGIDLLKWQSHYGFPAVGSMFDEEVLIALKRWKVGDNGKSWLLEHTVLKDVDRLTNLELRAGYKSGELAGALSENPSKVGASLKSMDELALDVMNNWRHRRVSGGKVDYWAPGVKVYDDGIRVIERDGLIESVMPYPGSNAADW